MLWNIPSPGDVVTVYAMEDVDVYSEWSRSGAHVGRIRPKTLCVVLETLKVKTGSACRVCSGDVVGWINHFFLRVVSGPTG